MTTRFGKVVTLTSSNMVSRGDGYVISIEALLALAFDGEAIEINGTDVQATLLILHAASTGATVSVASGLDAWIDDGTPVGDPPAPTPVTPRQSLKTIVPGDPLYTAGPYRRTQNVQHDHYLVWKDDDGSAAPTGTQLQVMVGVG